MITVVDYQVGNTSAFLNMLAKIGCPCQISSDPSDILSSSGLILPGVGSFDFVMTKLASSKLITPIEKAVFQKDIPILGVCVGMQVMCTDSEEGSQKGLGWFDATVERFAPENRELPVPHMGWNLVNEACSHNIFQKLNDAYFYFCTHIQLKQKK